MGRVHEFLEHVQAINIGLGKYSSTSSSQSKYSSTSSSDQYHERSSHKSNSLKRGLQQSENIRDGYIIFLFSSHFFLCPSFLFEYLY